MDTLVVGRLDISTPKKAFPPLSLCSLGSGQHRARSGVVWGLLRWHSGKESTCQCRRCKRRRFDPWVRKIPWSRKWQPAPVFLPGESHRQRKLVGYSPWGCKESDMTERLSTQHRAAHRTWWDLLGRGVGMEASLHLCATLGLVRGSLGLGLRPVCLFVCRATLHALEGPTRQSRPLCAHLQCLLLLPT